MKKPNALRIILAMTVATTGVLGLAGCGAGQSSNDTANSFAVALHEQDASGLCQLAAIGGKPVAGDKDRTALCKNVLAPKIMVGMKGNSALKAPKITITEKGNTAKAAVAGLSSPLTLTKIDGRWLIAIA